MLKKQAALRPKRKTPAGSAELDSFRREMRDDIRHLLRIPASTVALDPRDVVITPRKGYRIQKLEFLSERGIYVPAWVYLPDSRVPGEPPILFVSEGGIARDGMEFGVLEKLARKGRLAVAVDVRGVGDTRPSQPGDPETTLQYLLWEMDESLLGMRVHDVLRSIEYTLGREDAGANGVQIIGKGNGALWALYAAALEERIQSVLCDGLLLSYGHLASSDRYEFRADVFALDVLKHFDLPQVATAVAGRNLVILSPVDAMRRPADVGVTRQIYRPAEEVFSKAGGRFRLAVNVAESDPADQYLALLRG
jgi:cephalosporin-C deacetylase-like acetyl esterase